MRTRGYSLLETLIAFFLLFVISVYLMQLFAGGFQTVDRSIELTVATFLAQQKMEEVIDSDTIANQSGTFTGTYTDYTFTVSTSDFTLDLLRVEVDVRGRRGATAHLVTLKTGTDFAGMATDSQSTTATFRRQQGMVPDAYDQPPDTFALLQALPANGVPAGVAVDDQNSVAWVADRRNKQLWYYNKSAVGGTAPWEGPYIPAGNAMGTPTGVATDAFANVAWVADASNNEIWYYRASDNSWRSTRPLAPPLGKPAGIGTDAAASAVWVVDASNQCVREYNDETQSWSPVQYGLGTLKGPQGIAVSHRGEGFVYVVDSTTLWKLDTQSGALTAISSLPGGLTSASGLAADPFGSTFWVNDPLDNAIWYGTASSMTMIGVP